MADKMNEDAEKLKVFLFRIIDEHKAACRKPKTLKFSPFSGFFLFIKFLHIFYKKYLDEL